MTFLYERVIMFGPPAAGKDTITRALEDSTSRIILFQKLKMGNGRSLGYRMVSLRRLSTLRAQGDILSEIKRYGNIYAIDHTELQRQKTNHCVLVIHTGSTAEYLSLQSPHTLGVALWSSREAAEARLIARDAATVPQRLAVWDDVTAELPNIMDRFDLTIRTDFRSIKGSAKLILNALSSPRPLFGDDFSPIVTSMGRRTTGDS